MARSHIIGIAAEKPSTEIAFSGGTSRAITVVASPWAPPNIWTASTEIAIASNTTWTAAIATASTEIGIASNTTWTTTASTAAATYPTGAATTTASTEIGIASNTTWTAATATTASIEIEVEKKIAVEKRKAKKVEKKIAVKVEIEKKIAVEIKKKIAVKVKKKIAVKGSNEKNWDIASKCNFKNNHENCGKQAKKGEREGVGEGEKETTCKKTFAKQTHIN